VVAYTPDEQLGMAAELDALPVDALLGVAMADYFTLREQARTCEVSR